MMCPRCRAENGPGIANCGQCGASLPVECAVCHAENPPGNRFCGQCAAPLQQTTPVSGNHVAAPSTIGEFKQVTVMFCDMVNSTGLAERLGDETLHDVLRQFLEAGIAEVHRYGGTVPQFTGDGFMALFGAPVAHEDHVRRALLAATEILNWVKGAPIAVAGREPAELAIRIGINTGLVIFGAVADALRMDWTAVGDTANIAARLQGAAEPNSIVISEMTLRLAGGYARVEPVGALQLKGKAESLSAFRLVDVLSRPEEAAALRSGSRMFVGRRRERAVLDELLKRAEQGAGQAIGIQGEPGIGKSRLVAELKRDWAERSYWIEGHCVSYGTGMPYLLVLDLLRSACGILDRDSPDEIAQKVRIGLASVGIAAETDIALLLTLLGIGGTAGPAAEGGVQAVRERAFGIFRRFAINASEHKLLVLALEDLHWVDKVSEDFLDALAEILPHQRILVLATYRPGYRPGWLDKLFATQIALVPLTREDSRQVLRSVLDRRELTAALAETILARAEGNPFFLEQLALHVGEHPGAEPGQSVPATIRDVVMARIDRLPEQTRRLLQIAAVTGREFSLRLISEVWRQDAPLLPLLRQLLDLGFLHERVSAEETSYVFRHVLTQDAAYLGLLARHRRQTHAGVGRALERLYPGRTDEVAELLALHYGRSDEAEKAVDYALLAAEKAQRRWANEEALSYFETALRRLDEMDDAKPNRLRRIDAVMKQVEVKLALGRHAEHVAALAGIRDIIEQSGDSRRQAGWNYWMGFLGCLTGGHPLAAIEHCRAATAIAAAADFDELNGSIQSCLAQAYIVAGELRPAIEAGERALAYLEAHDNALAAIRTLWHLSSAANYLGRWQASFDYCRRALEHATRLNDLRLKGVTLWRTGSAHIQQGSVEAGLRYCEEALALNPIPYDLAMTRLIHGYGLVKAGKLAQGLDELTDVVSWFGASHLSYVRAIASLWLCEGHLARNDTASAQPLLEEVLALSRSNGYLHYEALANRLLAECLALTRPDHAERLVEAALGVFERIDARNDFAKALRTKAYLQRCQGDFTTAAHLLSHAEAIFIELGTRGETERTEASLAVVDRTPQTHAPTTLG